MSYQIVAVGGTFDILHIGHITLLSKAFEVGQFVFIGLTSKKMLVNKKHKDEIKSFKVRRENLENWLNEQGFAGRYKIIELNDPYGPTINDPNIEALVASEETAKRIIEINDIRKRKGFKELELIKTPIILDEKGRKISSSKIREKELI